MILDLQHISETPIHNFKGGDGMVYTRMYSDDLNRIMLARITPGSSIGMHTHETNSEIVYVLSGTARIMMDDGEEIVHVEETRALAGRADDEHVLVDGGRRFNRAIELQGVDGFTRQAVQQHEHAIARRLNNPSLAVLVVDCDGRRVAVAAQ